jgi:hypothetical protein
LDHNFLLLAVSTKNNHFFAEKIVKVTKMTIDFLSSYF